ncbi:uroporphyrinogen-III synthase [uncultured Roseobacter sp.]|uniref:uroporphyrinogen-III synthase n=1 Tax=uncultured Roseobacter sp. TaxID=114847 RepID=UPI0026085607|nr:uroporphyrinogen-III synthase [uncultured Roseobacter sp.]
MGTPPIPLIMTRPSQANTRFIGQLPGALRSQVDVIESPLIEIVPVTTDIVIDVDDAVIFTSANAIPFAPDAKGRRAFCVGEATTSAAHEAGWQAIFAGQDADALVVFLSAYPLSAQIWHISGRHTRGQVAERLCNAGMSVRRITVYDQDLCDLTPEANAVLQGTDPVIVPLFSPRTAASFVQSCPKNAQPYVAALSAAVAEPLSGLPLKALEIADYPSAAAMIRSLEKLVADVSLG